MINNKIWAIVPAAGSGQRMGTATPKQYLTINGVTILEITLRVLLDNSHIDSIIVCLSDDDNHWTMLDVSNHLTIQEAIGGATRALSVMHGLMHIDNKTADDDWVLVHDAARPCLSQDMLNRLVNQLKDDAVGGILAVPAKDTLKISGSSGKSIDKTLDRSLVWQAQTPQMFRYGLLRDALQKSLGDNIEITDESSAMENSGHQVKLVVGGESNLKITSQEDLGLAAFIIETNQT